MRFIADEGEQFDDPFEAGGGWIKDDQHFLALEIRPGLYDPLLDAGQMLQQPDAAGAVHGGEMEEHM